MEVLPVESAPLTAVPDEAPRIVLDTNVVFDLWLFADPAGAPLAKAIESRRVRWIATPAMFDECFHVIHRGSLDAWLPKPAALHANWVAHCSIAEATRCAAEVEAPSCSDTDDQMFVDLAIAVRARWLLSRDRALLRLAAPLARFGVTVLSLADWGRAQAVIEAKTQTERLP